MNKIKVATIAGLAATLIMGAACGTAQSGDSDGHEKQIRCFTAEGKFVEWDDDCHDDGLFASPPAPMKTSGGMQTAGPVKTKAAPRPTRR